MSDVHHEARFGSATARFPGSSKQAPVANVVHHHRHPAVRAVVQSLDWLAMTARPVCLLALISGALAGGGCGTTRPSRESAPTAPMARADAMRAANTVRQAKPGRTAVIGQGGSMAPLYGDDSIVIFTPVDFHELEVGTLVAYRNSANRTVVHRLVRREMDGWVARGIANHREDPEKVTPDNFLGVVYGVFYSE